MRISDWSSDVCSSDLLDAHRDRAARGHVGPDTTEGLARRLQRLAMFEPIGLGRGIEFELHPPGAILEPGDVDQNRRALARGTSSSVGAERGCGVPGEGPRKRSGKESGKPAVQIPISA